jgi:hypothetical protein
VSYWFYSYSFICCFSYFNLYLSLSSVFFTFLSLFLSPSQLFRYFFSLFLTFSPVPPFLLLFSKGIFYFSTFYFAFPYLKGCFFLSLLKIPFSYIFSLLYLSRPFVHFPPFLFAWPPFSFIVLYNFNCYIKGTAV